MFQNNILKDEYDIRLYFLSRGFVCPNTEGVLFIKSYDNNKLLFELNILSKQMTVTMPDFQYNMMYPQARRNRVINYSLENTQKIISCDNLDQFLNDMITTYSNKGEL
jgi:hypothetical protein